MKVDVVSGCTWVDGERACKAKREATVSRCYIFLVTHGSVLSRLVTRSISPRRRKSSSGGGAEVQAAVVVHAVHGAVGRRFRAGCRSHSHQGHGGPQVNHFVGWQTFT